MKPYDLIVFDWDGTLMDSAALIAESMQAACRSLGLEPPTTATARHVIGMSMLAAVRHAVPHLPEADFPALFEQYRRHYLSREAELQPFEGVSALLQRLEGEGRLLAVATGKPRIGLERAFQATGFKRHFVASRCADESRPKPAPDMLPHLIDVSGVAPARTLMIGDTSHDLQMAANAGVDAVAVTYGAQPPETLRQHPARAYLGSVAALSAWLRED